MKIPSVPSRASGEYVRDRRSCIWTPIPAKSRPTRSARRARRSYLTAVTFRQHFSGAHKIIRLLNKRGLRSGGDGWSCAGCDGARVKNRCRTGRVPCWLGVGLRTIREYEGEIFTDYYFGEANTANKSDNQHNNAINENLNWGGYPGCYSSLPPTVDLVPRSRTIPGGKGGGGEGGGEEEKTQPTKKKPHSMPRKNS